MYGNSSGTSTTGSASDAALIASVKSVEVTIYEGSSQSALTGSVLSGTENVSLAGKTVLRLVAKDADNNTVVGVPLKLVLTGNGTVSLGTINASTSGTTADVTAGVTTYTLTRGNKTDASGSVLAVIDSGSDMTNRSISAYAQVSGSEVKSSPLQITFAGTKLSPPTLSPTTIAAASTGNGASYTLVNGAGAPIAGQSVSFSVNGGKAQTGTTDAKGQALFQFDAPSAAGVVNLAATALGVTSTQVLNLSQADTATANVSRFGSAFLTPSKLSVNANTSSADSNQVDLTVDFRDVSNLGLAGVLVGFRVDPASNYSGGKFFIGATPLNTPVATGTSGKVQASFQPGADTTSNNGLNLQACYWFAGQSTSSCIAGQIVNVQNPLTVVGPPVSLTIARSDALIPSDDGTMYSKVFKVQVTDAQGVLKAGAVVTPGISYQSFGKGYMTYSKTDSRWVTTALQWCLPKDSNGDNVLQSSEDFDGTGLFAPDRSAVAVKPSQATTDSTGTATFTVQYPKSVAPWVRFQFVASTGVEGTGSVARLDSGAKILLSELTREEAPAFSSSPYGTTGFTVDADGKPDGTQYPTNCVFIQNPAQ